MGEFDANIIKEILKEEKERVAILSASKPVGGEHRR